jgi:hypothetical protein
VHPMRILHLSPDALLALMRAHAMALEGVPAAASWLAHLTQHLEQWERARNQAASTHARLETAIAETAASEDSARQMLRSLWRDAAQHAGKDAAVPTSETWSRLAPNAQVEVLKSVAEVTSAWELPAQEKRQAAWKAHSSALERHRSATGNARTAWLASVDAESRALAAARTVMVASAHLCSDWADAEGLGALFPATA